MSDALIEDRQKKARDAVGDVDRWDRDHSWHPFTQMEEYNRLPRLQVTRGEGCWVFDEAGKRYMDGNASVWTNVHGHNHPELNRVLKEQADKIAHSTYLGLSHPVGAELGRKLVEIAPDGLDRVVFSDNGSNAVEIALKLSFQYWQLVGRPQKKLVVGLSGAYHGDTFGTMSVSDSGGFHGRYAPWQFDTRVIPAPPCVERAGQVAKEDGSASLEALEALLDAEGDSIASLIMEPWVQGAAGMRLQPKGFLRKVAALCRSREVHLILDEVFVGFGRMGSFFVCQQEGVVPDFLCAAKGLSAGYLPLAATLTSQKIYEAFLGDFESGKGFYHGHTFTGNPLAAAVSLRSIQLLEPMLSSGEVAERIEYFGQALAKRFQDHPNVDNWRQRGLAAALDLRPGHGKEPWRPNDRKGLQVCLAARQQGLLLRPLMDSVLIVPPIVISSDEIDFLCDRLAIAIEAVLN